MNCNIVLLIAKNKAKLEKLIKTKSETGPIFSHSNTGNV